MSLWGCVIMNRNEVVASWGCDIRSRIYVVRDLWWFAMRLWCKYWSIAYATHRVSGLVSVVCLPVCPNAKQYMLRQRYLHLRSEKGLQEYLPSRLFAFLCSKLHVSEFFYYHIQLRKDPMVSGLLHSFVYNDIWKIITSFFKLHAYCMFLMD